MPAASAITSSPTCAQPTQPRDSRSAASDMTLPLCLCPHYPPFHCGSRVEAPRVGVNVQPGYQCWSVTQLQRELQRAAQRWVYSANLWWLGRREGEGLVGATLVVARVGLPTPAFAGTGRHKGVPYDRSAMCRVSWPLYQGFVVHPASVAPQSRAGVVRTKIRDGTSPSPTMAAPNVGWSGRVHLLPVRPCVRSRSLSCSALVAGSRRSQSAASKACRGGVGNCTGMGGSRPALCRRSAGHRRRRRRRFHRTAQGSASPRRPR